MTPLSLNFKKNCRSTEENGVFTSDRWNADVPMAEGSLSGLNWPFGLLAMWPRAFLLKRYGLFPFLWITNRRNAKNRPSTFQRSRSCNDHMVQIVSGYRESRFREFWCRGFLTPRFPDLWFFDGAVLSGIFPIASICDTCPPMMDGSDPFSQSRDFKCTRHLVVRIRDFLNPVMLIDSIFGKFSEILNLCHAPWTYGRLKSASGISP